MAHGAGCTGCLHLLTISRHASHASPALNQVRAGEVAVLDCDAEGRTVVLNRSHANNIVAADIVYSSVAA